MMISTTGDPIIQLHRTVADSARAAAAGLPVVNSAGMRAGHAAILENAIADTRKVLGELARVAEVGAGGAGALADQDCENGRRYEGWDAPELERRGEPQEVRVI
ncbi:hypothetical protein [Mycobacteroides franklinii]|uniref:hypothetical protein n=1 Tax=Mycobacteroides franklinii TaxID=948102 RepID=UPI0018E3A5FC|nr:hypothetical protein [Mycobacteroides franklinii]